MKLAHKISIVMPTMNYYNLTQDTLRSLKKTAPDFKDIIVVEASDVKIRKQMSLEFPYVEVIDSKPSLSLSEEWNKGIERAWEHGSDIVCVINNDVLFPQSGWMEKLVSVFDSAESFPYKIGAVSPAGYRADETKRELREELIDGHLGYTGYYCPPEFAVIHAKNPIPLENYSKYTVYGYEIILSEYSKPIVPTMAMYGATFLLSRETWDEVGKFDEQLCFSNDESDYALRCWEQGRLCFINREAQVIHRGGSVRADGLYKLLCKKATEFNKDIVRPEWRFINKHLPQNVEALWRSYIPYFKSKGIVFHPFSLYPLELENIVGAQDVRDKETP